MSGRAEKGENVGLDRRGMRMMSQESFMGERARFFEHSVPHSCAWASPLSPSWLFQMFKCWDRLM